MSDPTRPANISQSYGSRAPAARDSGGNLGDILERVLDRGVVIVGDIRVNLLDIELLTIKLRLLIASVDTARELGIDWWEHDPWLSSKDRDLVEENRRLRHRLAAVEEGPEALTSGDSRSIEAARANGAYARGHDDETRVRARDETRRGSRDDGARGRFREDETRRRSREDEAGGTGARDDEALDRGRDDEARGNGARGRGGVYRAGGREDRGG
ncbi:gas vesicle protein [Sphaerisporangium corydalis]|uniref:Gas vesicle protein GvpJ n=1 Tax=Sphaerisporangium corydalis TaxID=1441875 RepID=A0ABV9EC99_9ACTN|nr:gas vesicle protein GvpJ [Sphaerisporangium corydalis]